MKSIPKKWHYMPGKGGTIWPVCAIRSKGDQALFGKTTQQMKNKLGVPKGRALVDFLPTITIKAKDFATEITVFNTKEKGLKTERQISAEHITNNRGVRDILLKRGIKSEELPT